MAMRRAYYSSSIKSFLETENDSVFGQLLINYEFETTDLQKNAWRKEIEILKDQLVNFVYGDICFEYTIPRIGHRIDVVCIVNGVIFLLEFKVGDRDYRKSTEDQVMDYALDLKYFHEESKERYIIPFNISTEALNIKNELIIMDDKIAKVFLCNKKTIAECMVQVLATVKDKPLAIEKWILSSY